MQIETRDGLLWPASDRECYRAVIANVSDVDASIAYAKGRQVAVQAGGNCGVWPRYMAAHFATVYTFEPDPVNFHCLTANVPENVVARMAALGDEPGHVGLICDPKNVGAHYIEGHGPIEVVTIDSLSLAACDLIALDIEGYELKALQGAADTIRRFRPVIQIEDKGLSEKYGTFRGDAERWLKAGFGYKVMARVNRDVILAP